MVMFITIHGTTVPALGSRTKPCSLGCSWRVEPQWFHIKKYTFFNHENKCVSEPNHIDLVPELREFTTGITLV